MTLPAPQYTPQPNYPQNGLYYGFVTVGSGANGTLHTAISNLEAFITTNNGGVPYYYEVLGTGLPNGLSAPSFGFLLNCPQHVVWAAPLVPYVPGNVAASGNLTSLNNGAYDSQLDAIGAAFANNRNGGLNDTIRPGWEYNFSNYPWGIGVNGNTYAQIAAGMDRYMSRVRNAGFKGRFALNGDYDHTPVTNLMARYDLVAILDKDFYNGLHTSGLQNAKATTQWSTVWTTTNEAKYNLEILAAAARRDGKLIGFSECGVQIVNNNHQCDLNATYWSTFKGWITDNADIVAYLCPYNQNQSGGEEDQMFFFGNPSGTAPSGTYPNYINLGSQQNTSASGSPIVLNPYSKQNAAGLEYMQYVRAGEMQVVGTPVTPPPAFSVPQAAQKSAPLLNLALYG